jgi:ApbE superfamily uncharacterized protein (UPF0280 family)
VAIHHAGLEIAIMRTPQIALLPDGRRLHLQDGPIDLVIEAFGADAAVQAAYRAAVQRFTGLLDELVAELALLRAPAAAGYAHSRTELAHGAVARRMCRAVAPFAADCFITPMAAVAGAVAEEILQAMTRVAPLARAFVNNGGDIAFHLAPGEAFTLGLVDRPDQPSLFACATISGRDPSRGIATSGWRGRSFSLGIADAVSVLAATAAQADAAATIIANAVDLPGHPAIARAPAVSIKPDNDLGERLVTRAVAPLSPQEIRQAIARGLACAENLRHRGLIDAAAIHLQGETSVLVREAFESSSGVEPAISASLPEREFAHV